MDMPAGLDAFASVAAELAASNASGRVAGETELDAIEALLPDDSDD